MIPCRVRWCSTVSYRFFSQYRLIAQEYGAILLSLSRAPQLSWDVPLNEGFLCDKRWMGKGANCNSKGLDYVSPRCVFGLLNIEDEGTLILQSIMNRSANHYSVTFRNVRNVSHFVFDVFILVCSEGVCSLALAQFFSRW